MKSAHAHPGTHKDQQVVGKHQTKNVPGNQENQGKKRARPGLRRADSRSATNDDPANEAHQLDIHNDRPLGNQEPKTGANFRQTECEARASANKTSGQ